MTVIDELYNFDLTEICVKKPALNFKIKQFFVALHSTCYEGETFPRTRAF